MSREKGTPKTGGRKKGKPNRVTADLREWINELLDDNRQLFIDDLGKIEPYQRLAMLEKLMAYIIPKMAAITAQDQIDITTKGKEVGRPVYTEIIFRDFSDDKTLSDE